MTTKRPKLGKPSIRERQREFVLGLLKAAVRKVFYELPYEEVSVERVAHEAGVSRGTVYLYFATKQAMVADLLTDDMEAMLELYVRLSCIPSADRASIFKWLKEYRAAFDARRKSMDLFPILIGNMNMHIIVKHRDRTIEALGRRFEAFRLEGLRPAAAARRRASAHMILFQLEQTMLEFSASRGAPDIEIGFELLTDRILRFIEADG